jgi:hypothetical protein
MKKNHGFYFIAWNVRLSNVIITIWLLQLLTKNEYCGNILILIYWFSIIFPNARKPEILSLCISTLIPLKVNEQDIRWEILWWDFCQMCLDLLYIKSDDKHERSKYIWLSENNFTPSATDSFDHWRCIVIYFFMISLK